MASALKIIEAKRDGATLPDDALREFVAGVASEDPFDRIPDYQVAAFLMAVFFRGLDDRERRTLTLAMRDSGETLEFPRDPARPVVDKHSTGGIGDTVSLPLAPLLACLGFRVPMISGRALGITGGTLDKLESIPGFTTRLDRARILRQVDEIGVAMAGQTERMVPADRRLYALRDVTGTVPSIHLITASILSKKLAENLDALVLDVKHGSGAFLPRQEDARTLAQAMVSLANACGVRTRALLTRMDTPLGCTAGNWLEVRETVECLSGKGPDDLRQLVLACAAHLLVLTRFESDLESATRRAAACLDSGAPRTRWESLLRAQGADMDLYHERLATDSTAPCVAEVPAPADGWIQHCHAGLIGALVRDLGAGRLVQEAKVEPSVGIDRLRKPGTRIARGEPLCRVHAMTPDSLANAVRIAASAFTLGPEPDPQPPLIDEIIG